MILLATCLVLGQWNALILSLLVSVAVAASGVVVCRYCCISCIRGLLQKLIDTAVTKQALVYQQLPCAEDLDDDEDDRGVDPYALQPHGLNIFAETAL